jgi:hypothetical protein
VPRGTLGAVSYVILVNRYLFVVVVAVAGTAFGVVLIRAIAADGFGMSVGHTLYLIILFAVLFATIAVEESLVVAIFAEVITLCVEGVGSVHAVIAFCAIDTIAVFGQHVKTTVGTGIPDGFIVVRMVLFWSVVLVAGRALVHVLLTHGVEVSVDSGENHG